ncbi:MAG: SDR family oxidoreductase [Clostridiaceae bacterium]|jgi:NAD(P)-dependent dehydrogenase (short-subunit alcohol dehydrogenase family)|nr:SDR family oxidoreductase [Bacillota bacterium]NLN51737.1 SDR family oxidoreductase [Clostridiaceae bacterium]
MNYSNKVVVITGGASGIGKETADMFRQAGAHVCLIDLVENSYFVGDLAEQSTLEKFAEQVIADYGKVDILINNAPPLMKGIADCSYQEFNYALRSGLTSAFYLTKLFLPYFAVGASIINISSSRDRMSQAQTESYTAAKGGIAALTHALAASLAGKVRVNSISPGWIDTTDSEFSGPDAEQHPVKRIGKPEDIANAILFLCSERASFITGENIVIDGGMSHLMIYHGDEGWSLED